MSSTRLSYVKFEIRLLDELGYGISFAFEAGTGDMVDPDMFYRFVADEGFHPIASETKKQLFWCALVGNC